MGNRDILTLNKKTWGKFVKSAVISSFRIAVRSLDFRSKIRSSTVIPNEKSLKYGEAHINNVSIMFIDIVNFTGIKSDDPKSQQRLLMQLDFLFSELFNIVEKHGGKIEKNTGDGLMAYFDTKNNSNSVLKAIECAITIIAAGKYLIHPTFKANRMESLEFRITIDYGLVTLAKIGSKGGKKFKSLVAIGKAANLASKIQSVAGANELIIGDAARRKIPKGLDKYVRFHKVINYKSRANKGEDMKYITHIFNGRWGNKNGFFVRLAPHE